LGRRCHEEKLIAIEVAVNRDGEYMKSFLAEARKQKQETKGKISDHQASINQFYAFQNCKAL
jgi:hypothetical protein